MQRMRPYDANGKPNLGPVQRRNNSPLNARCGVHALVGKASPSRATAAVTVRQGQPARKAVAAAVTQAAPVVGKMALSPRGTANVSDATGPVACAATVERWIRSTLQWLQVLR